MTMQEYFPKKGRSTTKIPIGMATISKPWKQLILNRDTAITYFDTTDVFYVRAFFDAEELLVGIQKVGADESPTMKMGRYCRNGSFYLSMSMNGILSALNVALIRTTHVRLSRLDDGTVVFKIPEDEIERLTTPCDHE